MSDFAEVQTLEKFLIDYDVQLDIPELQREFVWNEKYVSRLLDSIDFHERQLPLEYLFIGSMLLHQEAGTTQPGPQIVPYWYQDYNAAIHGIGGWQTRVNRALTRKGGVAATLYDPAEPEDNFNHYKNLNKRIQLIDGQQRITVLTILARVLEKNPNIADPVIKNKLKLIYQHTWGEKRVNHSEPSGNRDYSTALGFDYNLPPRARIPEQPHLADRAVPIRPGRPVWTAPMKKNLFRMALKEIIDWLDEKFQGEWAATPTDKIENFAKYMIENTRIVPVAVNDDDQIHLIFRSSNAFGYPLSEGEKIKNEIYFHATRAGNMRPVKAQWTRIHQELAKPSLADRNVTLDSFLTLYARTMGIIQVASGRSNVRLLNKKQIYDTYAQWVNGNRRTKGIFQQKYLDAEHTPRAGDLLNFVTDLADAAEAYAELSDETTLKSYTSDSIQQEIEGMLSLSRDQAMPYILCLYKDMIYNKTQPTRNRIRTTFADFLKPMAAIFVYRMILQGLIGRDIRDELIGLAKIFAGPGVSRAVKLRRIKNNVLGIIARAHGKALAPTGGLAPADIIDIENALETRIKGSFIGDAQETQAKFILRGVFGISAGTRGGLHHPTYTTKKYHVEHILPKAAAKHWGNDTSVAYGEGKTWYYEHITDGGLIFGRNATQLTIQELVNKIGNLMILEGEINLAASDYRLQGSGRVKPRTGYRQQRDIDNAPVGDLGPTFGKLHYYRWHPVAPATLGSRLKHVEEFCNRFMDTTTANRNGCPAPAIKVHYQNELDITGSISSPPRVGLTDGDKRVEAATNSRSGLGAWLDIEVRGNTVTKVTALTGSGFVIGDTLTVDGAELGGASLADDVIITLQAGDLADSTTGPYRWSADCINTRTNEIADTAKQNAAWKVW